MKKLLLLLLTIISLLALTSAACRPSRPATPTPVPSPTPVLEPTPVLSPTPGPTVATPPVPSPTPASTPTATPLPTPAATPTSATTATYSNQDYGISISFPRDWVEQEREGTNPLLVISGPGGLPEIQLFVQYLPQIMSPSEYAAEIKTQLQQAPGFKLTSEQQIEIQATPAHEINFTMLGAQNTPLRGKMVFLVRDGSQGMLVQAVSTTTNYERRQQDIDNIIASLKLEEPRPFGVLRSQALTLYDQGPVTLDPAVSREARSHVYINSIFSGLVALDDNLQPAPDIAESWEISPDSTVYTFHLRRGVKFHNGREVKAADFKYSWERALAPGLQSQTAQTYLGDIVGADEMLKGQTRELGGVTVLDDYTLQVTIDAAKIYFLAKLTYPTTFVVDRTNVEAGGEWWRNPNGTGPFKLAEWKEDNLLVLERNGSYYGEPAGVDHVVFRLYGGIPMIMYENGEIDVSYVSISDVSKITDPASPLYDQAQISPELSVGYVSFNPTRPPFDDVRVRRAFSRAIDKDKIVSVVFQDVLPRADGLLPPGLPGFNSELKALPFDAAQARAQLDSYIAERGPLPPVTITSAGVGGDAGPLVSAMVDMWRQNLGIEVQVRLLDPDVFSYSIKQQKDEMFIGGWIADYPDPQNFLDVLFHSGSHSNDSEYSNPQFNALVEKARSEADVSARLKLYQQAEQLLVDDAAMIPLYFGRNYILVKPYVKGFALTPQGYARLDMVSLEPH
ncbi:MAG: hypothetical protein HY669_01890 [Chloroflexi bacterium]|nr:hypothetical protein [Chloroflexota bacterium]